MTSQVYHTLADSACAAAAAGAPTLYSAPVATELELEP